MGSLLFFVHERKLFLFLAFQFSKIFCYLLIWPSGLKFFNAPIISASSFLFSILIPLEYMHLHMAGIFIAFKMSRYEERDQEEREHYIWSFEPLRKLLIIEKLLWRERFCCIIKFWFLLLKLLIHAVSLNKIDLLMALIKYILHSLTAVELLWYFLRWVWHCWDMSYYCTLTGVGSGQWINSLKAELPCICQSTIGLRSQTN